MRMRRSCLRGILAFWLGAVPASGLAQQDDTAQAHGSGTAEANAQQAAPPDSQPPMEAGQPPASTPEVQEVPVKVTAKEKPAASDATVLDTIEVTAGKRVKAQRDIPGSVGAIRGEELEQMKAQGMKDYLKVIPGVFFADTGDEESVPVIRGIATQLTLGFTAQTTEIGRASCRERV